MLQGSLLLLANRFLVTISMILEKILHEQPDSPSLFFSVLL